MEISLENIEKRGDPCQLFMDSMKNPETARRYRNTLYRFLKLVPTKLYTESLGKTPENNELGTLAKYFVELARKDPTLVNNILATLLKTKKNHQMSRK